MRGQTQYIYDTHITPIWLEACGVPDMDPIGYQNSIFWSSVSIFY